MPSPAASAPTSSSTGEGHQSLTDSDTVGTPSADVLDGVTGGDDGGREDGDVELAILRPKKSVPTVSEPDSLHSDPSVDYRRYIQDPLSMFTNHGTKNDVNHHSLRPAHASSDRGGKTSAQPDHTAKKTADDSGQALSTGLEKFVLNGVAWRDAMVQACSALVGKSVPDLQREYETSTVVSASPNSAFSSEFRSFEPAPRDLADYAIMTTLKLRDAFAMENATSWLFNIMDRTGAGYVLKEEFVRYSPFIGPVADAAVAGLIFDELVKAQARESDETNVDEARRRKSDRRSTKRERLKKAAEKQPEGFRRRRRLDKLQSENSNQPEGFPQSTADSGEYSIPADGSTEATMDGHSRDLYPPSAAIRFESWRNFFQAIRDKYECADDDWYNVKKDVGIDPHEILIKSQGALDHSDIFPTLGKLYLSQRYLVFYAAVGRNHYVVRLGGVADVSSKAIPLMMRDCVEIHLESEAKAALDGVRPIVVENPEPSTSKDSKTSESNAHKEQTSSQHIGKLMRSFSSGRKPLVFSLLEFREKKRRDNWANLIKEMVAAHKLHSHLGFGSTGRIIPSLQGPKHTSMEVGASIESCSEDDTSLSASSSLKSLNYERSPFRNEQSPPLLAVASHSNIVRYRALRRVTFKQVGTGLLLFSHAERNNLLINWYVESVRSHDPQNRRTWIERAFAAIRENMDTNKRIYNVQDDEPFDVGKLGEAIGRFAELCSPMARMSQFLTYLFQWRNPPATILAILICSTIASRGLVHYVPAMLVFLQAAWVIELKYNYFGLGVDRAEFQDAEQRQANVLALVAQVHDCLEAAQNVLGRLNNELGKVEGLFRWGCEDWQSWVAVGALCAVGIVLLVVPARMMFVALFFMLFFKHFLPPTNPAIDFWQSLPSRIEDRKKIPSKIGKPSSAGNNEKGRLGRKVK